MLGYSSVLLIMLRLMGLHGLNQLLLCFDLRMRERLEFAQKTTKTRLTEVLLFEKERILSTNHITARDVVNAMSSDR